MAPAADRQRPQWFRTGYPDLNMRVSDADRSDVADRLAKHYGDGRLDKTEFDERVSRAMTAKTLGDFQGLFEDLPDLPGPASAPGGPPPASSRALTQAQPGLRRRPVRTVLLVMIVFILATAAWHTVFHPLLWLVAVGVVFAVASRSTRRSNR